MGLSRRMDALMAAAMPIYQFEFSPLSAKGAEAGVSNFAFGNPQEMPLTGFVGALQKWSVPQNKDWFAYKMSEPAGREAVANVLRERRGMPFVADDILLTNGAFAGLSVCINALVDPGDEVIFISPPWFFYEALIVSAGGTPVRVKINPETYDLDLSAIEAAITPKTRAIIINSPNNPTGKIYPPATLEQLGSLLTRASERNGRTIYLLSDEAYSRIIFDDRVYTTPTAYYPHSLMIYTYGKVLLTPGQRIGYIALPPTMPEREEMRVGLMGAQLGTGYAFPNAILQYALGDLENLSIDIPHFQHKRDWLVKELRRMGYQVHSPEGTFYLLPRSPIEDDWAFVERLLDHNIFCLPGKVCEMPGYFRISLTANDDMIERALPGFEAAIRSI